MNLSICGIDCDKCSFFTEKKCEGCRKAAPDGKCVWNGRCDLYDCASAKNLEDCGRCSAFPCEMLEEWSKGENGERIDNLKKRNKEK